MSKNAKIIMLVVIAVLVVTAILLYIFLGSKTSSVPKSVYVKSYDGKGKLTIDTSSENIISANTDFTTAIVTASVQFKDRAQFIKQLEDMSLYIDTFEYHKADGQTITQILFNKDGYYYIAQMQSNSDIATFKSLFANISQPDMYPIFNSSIYVDFRIVDGKIEGGSKTFTIDQLNSYNDIPMVQNAFTNYEDVKKFYSRIDSNLYIADDSTQTIKIKVYSTTNLNNGTHYFDGYPVTITFTQENTVVISLDVEVIVAG